MSHGELASYAETRLAHLPVYRRFIESLQEVDGRLVDHFIALIFLHFTELLEQGRDNSGILEVIVELMQLSKSRFSLPAQSQSSSTNTPFTSATNILIKLKTGIKTDTGMQVELAKAFLHMSVDNADVDQAHEDCLARFYLACLYYSTELYQTAFDQFLLATKSSQTQCSSHVVEMPLLPDNDDDIHVVSGLIVLYQFITQRTSSCQQASLPRILTANLCSMFYMIKCGRRLVKDTREISQRYEENIRQSESLFIGDFLLMCFAVKCGVESYSRRSTCVETISRSQPTKFNMFRLRCLIMKSAVERLTAVRHVSSRDYSSVEPLQQATMRQCMHTNVASMNVVYICVNRISTVYVMSLV